MGILTLILPFALKFLDKYLGHREDENQLKEKWLEFIYEMARKENNSKRVAKTINEIQTRAYKNDIKLAPDYKE
jgi:hypothetical protein